MKYPKEYKHPGFIWVSHPLKLEYHPPWPSYNMSEMSEREANSMESLGRNPPRHAWPLFKENDFDDESFP